MTEEEKQKILEKRRKEIDLHVGSKADYHDSISSENNRKLHISCYRCQAGCVHIEYESLMISCGEAEFMQLSDVIIQLRNSMLIEQTQKEDERFVLQGLM